jgi:hypothetical protein
MLWLVEKEKVLESIETNESTRVSHQVRCRGRGVIKPLGAARTQALFAYEVLTLMRAGVRPLRLFTLTAHYP